MGHAWIIALVFVVVSYIIMSKQPEWNDESWADAVQQFMVNLEFGWRRVLVMIVALNVVAFAVVLAVFVH